MIRAAEAGDADAVYALMRQLSQHNFTQEQFKLCYLYNLEHNYVLLYEQDRHICGCCVLNIYYPLHFAQKSAEIVNLIVDENARNRGIGRELVTSCERIASASGCICLEVASGKQRDRAHRFYEREGFVANHYKFAKEIL